MSTSPQPRPKESCISMIIKWFTFDRARRRLLGHDHCFFDRVLECGKLLARHAAKNDETQIVMATKAFYTEYGYYPVIGSWQTKKDAYYGPGPMPSHDLGHGCNIWAPTRC